MTGAKLTGRTELRTPLDFIHEATFQTACRALAAAKRVDEVIAIRDEMEHLRLYGWQVKDRTLIGSRRAQISPPLWCRKYYCRPTRHHLPSEPLAEFASENARCRMCCRPGRQR